jgi:hypothetical protein
MSDAKISKYEAWLVELEARDAELARHRPGYLRLFGGTACASVLGFFWNVWVGVGSVLTGILVFVFGYYVLAIRRQDYAREIANARAELRRLREKV